MRNQGVAKYSEEIVEIAKKYSSRFDNRVYKLFREGVQKDYLLGKPIGRPGFLIAMPPSVLYFLSLPLNLTAFAAGFATGAINRIADYSSSLKCVKEFEDKFFEYGLDEWYVEGNPLFPKHPTKKEFMKKAVPMLLCTIALSTAAPFYGYSLCVDSPFIYANNYRLSKEIKTSKKIGDKINEKLKNGEGDIEIEKFLGELYNNPKLIKNL